MLGIAMLVFVPMFFFASEYAQIALGKTRPAGRPLPSLFLPGLRRRLPDRRPHPRPARRQAAGGDRLRVVGGRASTCGPGKVTKLNFSTQVWPVILAGAGMGFMLTPASTDAINRASRLSYGEATGITQTVRNYSASLGWPSWDHPGHRTALPGHLLPASPRASPPQGERPGRPDRPGPGHQRQRRQHPPLHPPRLCLRQPHGVLRHGRHHGGRCRSGLRGPGAGSPAGRPGPGSGPCNTGDR